MRLSVLIVSLVAVSHFAFAQGGSDTLVFKPVFGDSSLVLDDAFYKLKSGDSLRFETLKFYISGIKLFRSDKVVWKEENSFHLIDVSDPKTLCIPLHGLLNSSFTELRFNLGVDSITNVSGAMGGDLDPTKGMYWTWQNGYINVKLEGTSNLCKTRNHEFQFHLGGYQSPYKSVTPVILKLQPGKNPTVTMDLENIVNKIDFVKNNHIMSPSAESVVLTEKMSDSFSIKAP
jgi:hypothetical protein